MALVKDDLTTAMIDAGKGSKGRCKSTLTHGKEVLRML